MKWKEYLEQWHCILPSHTFFSCQTMAVIKSSLIYSSVGAGQESVVKRTRRRSESQKTARTRFLSTESRTDPEPNHRQTPKTGSGSKSWDCEGRHSSTVLFMMLLVCVVFCLCVPAKSCWFMWALAAKCACVCARYKWSENHALLAQSGLVSNWVCSSFRSGFSSIRAGVGKV